MERFVAGDESGLDRLIARHGWILLKYLERLLENTIDAEEALQQTFLRVWRYRRSFNPRRRFATWLYGIAVNVARDIIRSRYRSPKVVSINDAAAESGTRTEMVPDEAPAPDQALIDAESRTLLYAAIERLPAKLRRALVLFAFEHLPCSEIADRCWCPRKAVEGRLYQARLRLKQNVLLRLHYPWLARNPKSKRRRRTA